METRPFVGREKELTLFEDALRTVQSGRGRVITVSGDAGVGKTRFLEEAVERVTDSETPAVWCHFYSSASDSVFSAWSEVARKISSSIPIDDLPLLESFLSLHGDLDVEDSRDAVFEEIVEAITRRAKHTSLVLVFEDIHDIDGPSQRLLDYVSKRIANTRVAIVASYRPPEATRNQYTTSYLDGIRRLTNSLELGLDEFSFEEFLVAVRPITVGEDRPDKVRWLYFRTNGNPFYLWAYIDDLRAKGRGLDVDVPDVPVSVQAYIMERLRSLKQPIRELLYVAAVVGPQLDLTLVEECLDEQTPLFAGVDGAKNAGLLRDSQWGGVVFAHELVRETLLAKLGTGRAAEIHLAVARALEARSGAELRAAEIAHHFRGAIPLVGSDPFVRRSAAAARESIARLAYEDVVDHANAALPLTNEPRHRAELLFYRGRARSAMGEVDAAIADIRAAFDLYVGIGDKKAALAVTEFPIVSYPVKSGIVDLAIAALEIAESEVDKARLTIPFAFARYYGEFNGPKAVETLKDAIDRLTDAGDSKHRSHGMVNLAQILIWEGRLDESLALCEELTEPGVSMDPVTRTVAHHYASFSHSWQGNLAATEFHAMTEARRAERMGHADLIAGALMQIQQLHYFRGELDAAQKINERCAELLIGSSINLGFTVRIAVQDDRLKDVQELPEKMSDFPDFAHDWSKTGVAMNLCESGIYSGYRPFLIFARDIAEPLLEGTKAPLNKFVAWYALVVSYAGLGEFERIPDVPPGVIVPRAGYWRTAPLVALKSGDRRKIDTAFEESYAKLRQSKYNVYAAWLSVEEATMARQDDPVRAAALLDRALRDAETYRLPLLTRRAQELRERLTPSVPSEIDALLTAREREVLNLVSTGATNSEIASTLNISGHTAANHVRNILQKTGFHNRTELAGYALRGK